jgi:RNA polymerase sigma-70 factor (ECF subfamily)
MSESAGAADDLEERLKSGDAEALAALFSRHRERLWQMVHFRLDRRLGGRVDPEDILQEAYLAAAQRIQHYRDESANSSFLWLRMIVTQTIIDTHRRHLGAQQRDARRELHGSRCLFPQTTSTSLASQLLGHLTSPSQAAMRAELSDQLEQAIAAMEPIDQEIVALRHFEELTNSEVAQVLGIQVKAASIRYVRALKRLQEILSRLPGFAAELSHA